MAKPRRPIPFTIHEAPDAITETELIRKYGLSLREVQAIRKQVKAILPRAPLPKQRSGPMTPKTKRPPKHKKRNDGKDEE